MSSSRFDCLIVGSGLFGSVVARELCDAGLRVSVLERRPFVGGNCRTYVDDGIVVHAYGAHIFNTDSTRVWDYVRRFSEMLPFRNSPVAVNGDRLYALPINMLTFNQLWGVLTPEAARKRVEEQIQSDRLGDDTVEGVALSTVGKDVYETLIRDYTEKQWGRRCCELPGFILRRIPVRYTYDNNYYSTRYQGIPVGGYSLLINNLLKGVDVRTGMDDGETRTCVRDAVRQGIPVVWTGAIDEYFDHSLGRLDYRSLRFETRWESVPDFQGNAVVNYCDRRPYTRSIEHKHFMLGSGQGCEAVGRTVVSLEYPIPFSGDAEPYYPVNDTANTTLYGRYQELASGCGILFGGRLGSYRYTSMSDTVENALTFVESGLSGTALRKRKEV